MLNVVNTSVCSGDIVNMSNRSASNRTNGSATNNNNVQNFNENLKTENKLNGERHVVFKKPENDATSASSTQRAHFQRFFLQKYPDFLRNYCMCLYRKIEPDDLNDTSDAAADKYSNNGYLSRTPIIPITVDPNMYV